MRKQSQQCQESTVAPYIVEQFIWMHCIQPQLINIHRDINIKGKKPGTFFVWLTTFRKLIKALFVIEWVFCCGGTFLFGVESFFFDVGVFVRLTVKLTFYCNCLFFLNQFRVYLKLPFDTINSINPCKHSQYLLIFCLLKTHHTKQQIGG